MGCALNLEDYEQHADIRLIPRIYHVFRLFSLFFCLISLHVSP